MSFHEDGLMRQKDFEATYREMQVERLLRLTTEMEDLVPEARAALLVELRKRGVPQSDVERVAADAPGDSGEPVSATGEERPSVMIEGPAPADWIRIPRFGIQEAVGLAACMEHYQIPFQIEPAPGYERRQHLLVVPPERFKDCVAALKEYYGLLDELPEAFTGDCPACGAHLSGVTTCTDCGLVLCLDGWDSYGHHPFAQFLTENGLGRPAGDAGEASRP